MNPTQLSAIIGIDAKEIRKYARKAFVKTEGNWNFTESQIQIITSHFNNPTPFSKATKSVVVPPIDSTLSISLSEMITIAKAFLKDNYSMDLKIPIEINNRIKNTLGRFRHIRGIKRSVKIEMGLDLIKHHPRETVIDVLKHELIHYALYELGHPHRDGDAYFEMELIKKGVSRTHTFQAKGERHQYKCKSCQRSVATTTRRIKTENKITRCCNSGIEYIGKVTL